MAVIWVFNMVFSFMFEKNTDIFRKHEVYWRFCCDKN